MKRTEKFLGFFNGQNALKHSAYEAGMIVKIEQCVII